MMARPTSMPRDPTGDGWLTSLCLSRTLMTSIFMAYAASLPVLRGEWAMSATAAGSVSTAFQLGYAFSLLLFSWLADRVGARRVFLGSSALSAGTIWLAAPRTVRAVAGRAGTER